MRKLILFVFVILTVNASAQWTIINGKQRFAKGLGIPVADTATGGLNDSAQIVLRPQDSTIYFKYKGAWRKMQGGTTQIETIFTRIIRGGVSVSPWSGNRSFSVSECVYDILGTRYESDPIQIVIDTPDASPRFDVIALDTTGNVVVIKGTPSANPVKPVVNPISQIELSFIYVNSTVEPQPITLQQGLIYNENLGTPSEWNSTVESTTNMASTNNPYLGTKCMNMYNIDGKVLFESPININIDTINSITFFVRLPNPQLNRCSRYGCVMFNFSFLIDGVIISQKFPVTEAWINIFDTGWQQVTIPFSKIVFDGVLFNQLSISQNDDGQIFYDNIYLEANNNIVNQSGGVKKIVNEFSDYGTPIAIGTVSNQPLNLISNGQNVVEINPNREMVLSSIYDSSKKITLISDKPYIKVEQTEPPEFVGDSPHYKDNILYHDRIQVNRGDYDTATDNIIQETTWLTTQSLNYFKTFTNSWTMLFNKNSNGTVSIPNGSGYMPLKVNSVNADSTGNIKLPIIDSLKRSTDSVFARKNNSWVFQYKDTLRFDTATVVLANVTNADTGTLQRGEVVYLFGATGDRASVKRANNKSDTTSSKTFAIVRDPITQGNAGYVVTQGQCGKLNLSAYNAGDILWLDSISGQLTKNKPQAPYHQVFIGVVERANAGNGLLYVKPQNGYELGELHNVQVNSQNNNDVLYYDSVPKLWKAKSAYLLVDTTKLSTRIDARVKYTDTATMLTPYLRKTDTATLSTRIDAKIGNGDTSVFQRKNIGSYSFMANKTNASANVTNQAFRDSMYTLSAGEITWTGTTAPSGTKDETIRWVQVGNMVTITVTLYYSTAGTGNSAVTITLPSSLPTPYIPSGMNSALRMIAFGTGAFSTNYQQPSTQYRSGLRRNSANTGNEIFLSTYSGSAAVNWAQITVTYFTN